MSIVFYFDYISPYAYLASTQLPALAARHAREIRAVPVLFAAMLDASGARGPAEIPMKREYMFRDVNRLAKMLGARIEPPATHPFNPLAALRMSHAANDWRLVEALYRATWCEARRVDRPEVVIAVANEIGLDGEALFEQSQGAEIKARLRSATPYAAGLVPPRPRRDRLAYLPRLASMAFSSAWDALTTAASP